MLFILKCKFSVNHEILQKKYMTLKICPVYCSLSTLVYLEEKTTKLERKAEIAEMVYDMACDSGGNEALREKLIDVMYENEQLKAENSKLRELLEKAYEFMKQFVLDGRNLLERFLESVGQVVEKVRG